MTTNIRVELPADAACNTLVVRDRLTVGELVVNQAIIGPTQSFAPEIEIEFVASSSGSDETGDGSAANPWRTITHAVDEVHRLTGGTGIIPAGTTYHVDGTG